MQDSPNHVQLELTNACNIDCAMCARSYMRRPVAHMSLSLFQRSVDEIIDCGWPLDWLHHMGEPLLWKHLGEVGYVFRKGLSPTISTNCVPLTDLKSRLLLDAGCTSFLLCVDTALEEVYRQLRGGNFRRVVRNVKRFLKLRSDGGYDCDVYIQWLRTRLNYYEGVEGLMNLFGREVEYVRKKCDRILHPEKNLTLKEDGFRSSVLGCPQGLRGCCILVDGSVTPCCWDYDGAIHFGKIGIDSLGELYSSEAANRFRDGLRGYDILHALCSQCIGPDG